MRHIVTFFDTNVLVYATIDQDPAKLTLSEKWIEAAITEGTFYLSPLVLNEYIFILSKLKILHHHEEDITLYAQYVQGILDRPLILSAYAMCQKINFCRNINDAIHLKTAEIHCDKLVTFDRDFKRFIPHTPLEIDILG